MSVRHHRRASRATNAGVLEPRQAATRTPYQSPLTYEHRASASSSAWIGGPSRRRSAGGATALVTISLMLQRVERETSMASLGVARTCGHPQHSRWCSRRLAQPRAARQPLSKRVRWCWSGGTSWGARPRGRWFQIGAVGHQHRSVHADAFFAQRRSAVIFNIMDSTKVPEHCSSRSPGCVRVTEKTTVSVNLALSLGQIGGKQGAAQRMADMRHPSEHEAHGHQWWTAALPATWRDQGEWWTGNQN
jgi:hypothetical protein